MGRKKETLQNCAAVAGMPGCRCWLPAAAPGILLQQPLSKLGQLCIHVCSRVRGQRTLICFCKHINSVAADCRPHTQSSAPHHRWPTGMPPAPAGA